MTEAISTMQGEHDGCFYLDGMTGEQLTAELNQELARIEQAREIVAGCLRRLGFND